WKLLSDWVSPPDQGDELELAGRYIESVKLSPLKNAKVDQKAKDYFTVKRGKGSKLPTVVYTIKVTDPALLADIHEGDTEEVYQYVEPGKGAKLPKPGRKPAPQAAPAAPAGPKSYDDLRAETLSLMRGHPQSWGDWLIEHHLLRWARSAPDEEVKGWLPAL